MAQRAPAVPETNPRDSNKVKAALAAARRFWDQGQKAAAADELLHAAAAAAHAHHHARSAELTRVAAELRNLGRPGGSTREEHRDSPSAGGRKPEPRPSMRPRASMRPKAGRTAPPPLPSDMKDLVSLPAIEVDASWLEPGPDDAGARAHRPGATAPESARIEAVRVWIDRNGGVRLAETSSAPSPDELEAVLVNAWGHVGLRERLRKA